MIIFNNRQHQDKDYRKVNYAILEKLIDDNITLVALHLDQSPQFLYLIWMLYKNGVAFILIDPTFPPDRINYLLKDSNVQEIITLQKYHDLLRDFNVIFVDNLHEKDTLTASVKTKGNETAYILYTSGSTGMPKGVEISREALENFIEGISARISLSPQKRIICLTSVSFDIFLLESLVALILGLDIVLANESEKHNPKLMARLILEHNVDMIQMTPSRMQLLLNYDEELACLKNVKEIMIGGEPFPLKLLQTLQNKTSAQIYNMYGPTETTIWSTISDLTNKNRIDIGFPILNTEIYIVDENLSLQAQGQKGEICIAGKGLAQGYVGKTDLTNEKFVYLPQKPTIKVYRTGDLGRYLEDGNLECLGRTDNQVKIRGYRIELEEIELHLNKFDGIKQSIVIALETNETEKILQALYTSENSVDSNDITDYLSAKLPSYMIPAIFKHIMEFIQTANGKIDRKRVLECVEIKSDEAPPEVSVSDKLTDVQKSAFEVIIENLSEKVSDNVSLDMDFNSIGLDSITFIKTIVALECEFNFEFDDEMLLITKFPTIKSMIEYVESKV